MGMPQPNIGQTPGMGARPANSFSPQPYTTSLTGAPVRQITEQPQVERIGRPDLNSPEMIKNIAQNTNATEQRNTGGYKPTTPPQPNVFQQSSQAYSDALGMTRSGAMTPIKTVGTPMVQGQGYSPATGVASLAGSQGFKESQIAGVSPIQAQQVSTGSTQAFGYDPSTMAGVDPITAERVRSQQIAQGMGTYQNPYTQQVVDQTMQDLERQRLMQQNQVGAQATAANAFGGSRQGVAEAETNRAFAEQMARTSAQLRAQGFDTAAQLSGQDIQNRMRADLANQSAALQADTTTAQQALQTQQANQNAINQARSQLAQARNAAEQADAQRALQAALANQQASLQAQTTTGQQALTAQQANQQAQQQARQFGASAANQAALANQQALNQMTLSNMGALNQAGQFGAQAQNQASLANQQASLQAQLANQRAQEARASRLMSAGSQMGSLSNLGFGFGRQLNQDQMAAGNQQRALQQAIIDASRNQFNQFANQPQTALQAYLSALGQGTGQQTQTQTRNPGLFDFLSLGASILPR